MEKYCRAWQATDDNTGVRFTCWVSKATNTHSEYVILIGFPLSILLHERSSLLRYTYIACLVQFVLRIQIRECIERCIITYGLKLF